MYESLVEALMQRFEKCDCMDYLTIDAARSIVELRDTVQSQASLIERYGGETGVKQLQEFAGKYWEALVKIPRWKPVHEILPEKSGYYLILWRPRKKADIAADRYFYELCEYSTDEGWISEIPQSAPMGGYEVCYWMDLPPEPRRGKLCL